jgi:WD40 repeat protein
MHRSQVRRLGFSPDGLFVWAVSDNDVHIWDTAAGLSVGPRLRHSKDPVAFAWSKDGQHFFTAGDSFSPKKWSLVPDARSPEDLQLVARAVSAHAFTAGTSDLRAVSLDESLEAWKRLGLVDPATK